VDFPARTRARADWPALRHELGIVEAFPVEAVDEANIASALPVLPAKDCTDIELWTLDPRGSSDLDQAMHLERTGSGYTVRYAIADVGAFVRPGGALDVASHARGVTFYCPDARVPLYPPVLSEGAASLLPGKNRPALLWTMRLGGDGDLIDAHVERSVVRSRRQLDYTTVAQEPVVDPQLKLLREIGRLRMDLARRRGAVDLHTPQQLVSDDTDGYPVLVYRAGSPAEDWNEQISLLTGMAAARLMIDGGVGLLRTLPPADPRAVASLRQSAAALALQWRDEVSYADFVSELDPSFPSHAAMLNLSARLLRGAGYVAFDGEVPERVVHNAVAAEYAHCTAPLRRLADRHVGEVCVALCAGSAVPGWARDALSHLPAEMATADRRANALDRASVDLAEAVVLEHRVGDVFVAVVVDRDDKGSTVQLANPPVRARCSGDGVELGSIVRVRLAVADVSRRHVQFEIIDGGDR
jgi:exoribonuclease R